MTLPIPSPSVAPIVIPTPDAMRDWAEQQRRAGRRIAVVPTMGALHPGHESLITEAARRAEAVVVTLFVNPMQFDRAEDFASYPRPQQEDLDICARHGVDVVYAPAAAMMYPPGFDTRVEPGELARTYEGAHRPGHFTGVATVVTKLLTSVQPHVAVFGEKDAQQLAIVRRVVRDLDLGVEIVGMPTVRESDGLALSSRNRRLDPAARAAAACIPQALDAARVALTHSTHSWTQVHAAALERLAAEPLAQLEYFDLVDPQDFTPLTERDPHRDTLLIIAVWVGGVRLIDNQPIPASAG